MRELDQSDELGGTSFLSRNGSSYPLTLASGAQTYGEE